MIGRRRTLVATGALMVAALLPMASGRGLAAQATPKSSPHISINCEYNPMCPDVANSAEAFGDEEYVGHDEPSLLFYSNQPGSGNHMRYNLTLPSDPSPAQPYTAGKSYNFELHPTFWLGMALCDTQSYPEQVSTCTPDSDSNIVDPAVSPNHPGTAFLELQFRRHPPERHVPGAGGCGTVELRVRDEERRRAGPGKPCRLHSGHVHAQPGAAAPHELG